MKKIKLLFLAASACCFTLSFQDANKVVDNVKNFNARSLKAEHSRDVVFDDTLDIESILMLQQLYEELSSQYPTATHDEILEKMYYILFEQPMTRGDYVFGLNSDEFWTIVANLWPWQYGTIGDIKNKVIDKTIYYYNHSGDGDDSDAFRHTYLSALLTFVFNGNFALQLTNAHEEYTGNDIILNNSKTMDLNNNAVGIELGNNYKNTWNAQMSGDEWDDLAIYVCHAVKYGSYYGIYRLTNGGLSFVNTTQGNRHYLFPPYC